jgi:multidrug efflux pump subunit AcrA (membrane-fusion protein)
MYMLEKLYSWYGRKVVWGVGFILTALIVIGLIIKFGSSTEEVDEPVLPLVEVASVSEITNGSNVTLFGIVAAVSEADIQSESSGVVTSVPVELGGQVSAGQVIATLENASQRAAVLQAEGAYEAALANASSNDVSVTQAETSLITAEDSARNALQNTYTTVSNGFYTVIDTLYNNPDSVLPAPYVSNNNSAYLRTERVAFRNILPTWQSQVTNQGINTSELIDESIGYTERTRNLVDEFITAIQDRDTDTLNGITKADWIGNLNSLRSSLDSSIIALQSAKNSVSSASDALEKARIGGTGTEVSASNAQVKQALGSLRAAEANLAKTIMRSPISGTVNELDVKVGDFVGSFTKVAKVANNQALEVTVFVGENDLEKISIGDTVIIDGEFEGTITQIGAGVDSDTQKTEVKIATETTELTNGDSVSVSLNISEAQNGATSIIMLPITAIKFTAEDGFVFTVENGTLVSNPVEVGTIRGGSVEIVDGVSAEMNIVLDARGLTDGTKVEATN